MYAGETNMNLKQYSMWGLAVMVAVGGAFWQYGWFDAELVTEPVVQHRVSAAPEEGIKASFGNAQKVSIKQVREVTTDKAVIADASELLQHAMTGFNQLNDKSNSSGGASGAVMLDQQLPSAEMMAVYQARKLQAEQQGLEYLLEQLDSVEGATKLEVIKALWRYAAKIDVPQGALIALDLASRDSDAAVAGEAAKAVADLRRFKQRMLDGPTPEDLALIPPVSPLGSAISGAKTSGATAADTLEYQQKLSQYKAAMQQHEFDTVQALAATLSAAVGNAERGEALHTLSLRHNVASVDAWIGFASNSHADVRYASVQNLWRSSTKGLDEDGRIASSLNAATWDNDKRVAELAKQAVADLKAFRQRQAQATAPVPSLSLQASSVVIGGTTEWH